MRAKRQFEWVARRIVAEWERGDGGGGKGTALRCKWSVRRSKWLRIAELSRNRTEEQKQRRVVFADAAKLRTNRENRCHEIRNTTLLCGHSKLKGRGRSEHGRNRSPS